MAHKNMKILCLIAALGAYSSISARSARMIAYLAGKNNTEITTAEVKVDISAEIELPENVEMSQANPHFDEKGKPCVPVQKEQIMRLLTKRMLIDGEGKPQQYAAEIVHHIVETIKEIETSLEHQEIVHHLHTIKEILIRCKNTSMFGFRAWLELQSSKSCQVLLGQEFLDTEVDPYFATATFLGRL